MLTPLLLVEACAAERVALILAAEEYKSLRRSEDSVNRGRELADALKAQGFEVTFVVNPSNASARAGLRDLADKVGMAKAAIVILHGHTIANRGSSFFLPVNAAINRSMDLLSQGISIQNVAQIASKAAYGAILVLSSVPDLPGTIDGLEPRPGLALAVPKNVSVAFSSSSKVPLSRVDALTRQVAADLVEVAREQKLSLSALINAASGGGIGLTYGAVPDVLLGLAAGQDKPRRQVDTSETEQAAQARRDQDQRLRAAEDRASRAEERARQAEATLRQGTARREEQSKASDPPVAPASPGAEKPASAAGKDTGVTDVDENDVAALQLIEGLLGRAQRLEIQEQLARLNLYNGPADAVFGNSTRQAIEKFQEQSGSVKTGYLTPRQYQALVRRAVSMPAAEVADRNESMIAEAMRGAARWEHKGQLIYLAARGLDRKFIGERTGGGTVLLFDGQRTGSRYRGTAYLQTSQCGRLPFPADGSINPDETKVTLTGQAPVTDVNCRIVGQTQDTMEFLFKAPSTRR